MTNKLWKLQSCDKLSSKINTPVTPIDLFPQEMFTPSDREELQGFTLSPIKCKQEVLEVDIERRKTKHVRNNRSEEPHKKEERKSRGLASKTKVKLFDQIKVIQEELQERQTQLANVTKEYNTLIEQVRQRRKQQDDISNNERMLKSKDDHLSDLMLRQKEIIETEKTDLQKEKKLYQQNRDILEQKKKENQQIKQKLVKKNQSIHYNEQLRAEKKKLESRLQELQKIEKEKLAMRSEAIREMVKKLISSRKADIERECNQKVKLIKSTAKTCQNYSDLKGRLLINGLSEQDYYTFSQLKEVQEFKFKENKQSETILQIFDKEIQPITLNYASQVHEPKELIELKNEITKLQKDKKLSDAQILQKEQEIKELEQTKKKAEGIVSESKKKKENS